MPFAVLVTVPRAGLGFAVAPYTVEAAATYASRQQAQNFADAKVMSTAMTALFAAMPSAHPAWATGVAVAAGAHRSYDGKTWVCIQGHTPIVGWEPPNVPALWSVVEAPGATVWAFPVAYSLPAQRSYAGRLYDLIQAHTSQAAWMPPAVPALWRDIGSALAVPAYTRAQWRVVDTAEPDYSLVSRAKEA